MQPHPVWKKRVVGRRKDAADRDVRLAVLGHERLVRVDRVEAAIASRCASGWEPKTTSITRPCVSRSTFIVQSSPHIDATSSMSERIGPTYAP